VGTIDRDAAPYGAVTATIGEYTNPDGVDFLVPVYEMQADFSAGRKARRWAEIGWDVAVAYQGFAFAAGTGTTKQTFTPEQPPQMNRTPLPGTEAQSRGLLARSPLLTEDVIEAYSITCRR
jgi:hypothetical protein